MNGKSLEPVWAALGLSLAALVAGFLAPNLGLNWFALHGSLVVLAFLIPLQLFFHDKGLGIHKIASPLTDKHLFIYVAVATVTSAFLAFNLSLLSGIGYFALAGFSGMLSGKFFRVIPKRKNPVANVKLDPLTKGDDACYAQMTFAFRFLPLGFLFLATGEFLQFFGVGFASRFGLSGMHILLVGFGLFSLYSTAHLFVPRLSGVPAIAKGAIKGELHSGLLGLVGMTIGFLGDWRGVLIGFGPVLFFSFFTFMGVIGANIMRNKSKTQRVTPEFVYIPWVFAGVMWLICGVMLGIFLNVIPELLAEYTSALKMVHVHLTLFGGTLILFMGLLTRMLPESEGKPTPKFGAANRFSFILIHLGLLFAGLYAFKGGNYGWLAIACTAVAIPLWAKSIRA